MQSTQLLDSLHCIVCQDRKRTCLALLIAIVITERFVHVLIHCCSVEAERCHLRKEESYVIQRIEENLKKNAKKPCPLQYSAIFLKLILMC